MAAIAAKVDAMIYLILLLSGAGCWLAVLPISSGLLRRPSRKRLAFRSNALSRGEYPWASSIREQSAWHQVVSISEIAVLTRRVIALLRSGCHEQALWRAARDAGESSNLWPALAKAAALAELGLSPSAAFRPVPNKSLSNNPSQRALVELAACLEVAEQSGAQLVEVLDRAAEHFDDSIDMQALRNTALAGPKATASLLSWLPLLGLGAGYLMGINPISILFGTPAGNLALLAGGALSLLARLWMSWLAKSAAGHR